MRIQRAKDFVPRYDILRHKLDIHEFRLWFYRWPESTFHMHYSGAHRPGLSWIAKDVEVQSLREMAFKNA